MKTLYIYTLSDPISNQIRYVGKTNSIKSRLQSHINYAKRIKRKPRHVSDWILSLLIKNQNPIITIIEEVNENNWEEREIFWIKHFRNLGFDLTNLTDGGGNIIGYVCSDELKEIRRKARLGYETPMYVKDKIRKTLNREVLCITDNIKFESMNMAVEYSGVPKTTFHRKLNNGKLINGKQYEWYNKQS